MSTKIEQLKRELLEFLELSKLAHPAPWGVDAEGDIMWSASHSIHSLIDSVGITTEDANLIVRSRNISPALAECLIATIDKLDDMPFNVADALEAQIITICRDIEATITPADLK